MTNGVAARMERLVLTLREMSQEIEPELHVVSQMARDEWRSLQGTWPSERQLREGTKGFTEEQLEAILVKAQRFKDIVHGLASREAGGPHVPLESIHLTPSTRPDEEEATTSETVMIGGDHRGSTREFSL
jgi:hypothetical protein